jgi:hypothetical protein
MAANDHEDEALPGSDPTPNDSSASLGETREQPRDDAPMDQTQDQIPSDPWGETEIRPVPGSGADGGTSILPAVDLPAESGGPSGGPAGPEPGSPRWTARAQVRTPDVEEEVHEEWREPPRGPLVPILVAVCIVLLIALVALGTWLIFADRPAATPTTTPTVQTATPPPPSNTKTSVTTTTTVPPAPVPIPDLRGQDYTAAAAQLTLLGFVPVRVDAVDADVPKGKVIGTDPVAGQLVRPGTSINVIVSAGAPQVPTPTPTVTPT